MNEILIHLIQNWLKLLDNSLNSKFTETPRGPIDWVSIGSYYSLVPPRQLAVIWTIDDLVHRCTNALLCLNEFMPRYLGPCMENHRPLGWDMGCLCGFMLWFILYLSHSNDICNIMLHWNALQWHKLLFQPIDAAPRWLHNTNQNFTETPRCPIDYESVLF